MTPKMGKVRMLQKIMKRIFRQSSFYPVKALLIGVAFHSISASAKVIDVVADIEGPPPVFILDDKGFVWSQRASEIVHGLPVPGEYFRLPGLSDIVEIVPYGALRRDGKVFTWHAKPSTDRSCERSSGCDVNFDLVPDFTPPKMVKGIEKAVKIEGGGTFHYYLVLLKNGQVVEWQEKCDGVSKNYAKKVVPPHVVEGVSDAISISVDVNNALVLTRAGMVYGWGGMNAYGELGSQVREGVISVHNPMSFYAGKDMKEIHAGNHTIAVTNDGHVLYWGGCSVSGDYEAEHSVLGYVDNIDNVDHVVSPKTTDDQRPIIYLRKDGSFWERYGPDNAQKSCASIKHPSEDLSPRQIENPFRYEEYSLPEE